MQKDHEFNVSFSKGEVLSKSVKLVSLNKIQNTAGDLSQGSCEPMISRMTCFPVTMN